MSATWISVTGGNVTAGGTVNTNTLSAGRQPFLEYGFSVPDTMGGNVTFYGVVAPVSPAGALAAAVAFTGSPIAMPAVPGGGLSLNWGLQVNTTTGAVTLKTGTAATTGTQVSPTPDAGNVMLFIHTLTNGDTIPWLRAPVITDLN